MCICGIPSFFFFFLTESSLSFHFQNFTYRISRSARVERLRPFLSIFTTLLCACPSRFPKICQSFSKTPRNILFSCFFYFSGQLLVSQLLQCYACLRQLLGFWVLIPTNALGINSVLHRSGGIKASSVSGNFHGAARQVK